MQSICIAPPTALSAQRTRWVVSPAVGGICVSLRRRNERHKDVAWAGVKDDGSTGHCTTANNITKQLGRVDPTLWPLHSLSNAGAGESGQLACYVKEHDSMELRSTLDNERVVIYLYRTLANSLN